MENNFLGFFVGLSSSNNVALKEDGNSCTDRTLASATQAPISSVKVNPEEELLFIILITLVFCVPCPKETSVMGVD